MKKNKLLIGYTFIFLFIDFTLFIIGLTGLISIIFHLVNNEPTDLNQIIAYISFVFIGNYAFFKIADIKIRKN